LQLSTDLLIRQPETPIMKFIRSIFVRVAAVLLLINLLPGTPLDARSSVMAQEAAPVAAPPVTGQYVPPSAIAVIVLHPQAFFSQHSMRMMPLELIRAAGEQQLGINPLQIQQIKIVIGETGAMGPIFGAVVQMAGAVALEDLNPEVIQTEQAITIGGREYYSIDNVPPEVMFHQVDPRTALVGMQPLLEEMLAATGDEPPLAPLLKQLQHSDHALAIWAVEPVRPMLQAALDQQLQMAAGMFPASILALRELPALTEHVQARLNFGDRFEAQLTFAAVDDRSSERLETLLNAALADTRQAMLEQMQPVGMEDPATFEALRDYAHRVSGEIIKTLTPVRDGDRVNVTVKEDIPHLMMLGMMSGISMRGMPLGRGAARQARSTNNLKQIGLAMHNYADAYRGFPDPAIRDADGKPLLSWRVAILPFVEQQALYEQFRLDEPWDSEHNLALAEKMPSVYRHPASTAPQNHTVYQVISGETIGLQAEGRTSFAQITDGTSNTMLAAEIEDEFAVPWTKPEDVQIDPEDPWVALGGHDREGVHALFMDGSVRRIPYWLEPEKLWHLMTRAGGEVVERF
jgi:hypothetical protein